MDISLNLPPATPQFYGDSSTEWFVGKVQWRIRQRLVSIAAETVCDSVGRRASMIAADDARGGGKNR